MSPNADDHNFAGPDAAHENRQPLPSVTKPFRRRSRNACLNCRTRKVRCDVARIGTPCTNCVQDQVECLIQARKRRSRAYKPVILAEQPQNQTYPVQSPDSNISRLSESADNDLQIVPSAAMFRRGPFADLNIEYSVSDQYSRSINGRANPSTLATFGPNSDTLRVSQDTNDRWTQGQDFRLVDLLLDYADDNDTIRSPAAGYIDWSKLGTNSNAIAINTNTMSNLDNVFPNQPVPPFQVPIDLNPIQNYPSPQNTIFAFTSWQVLVEPANLIETPAEDAIFLQAKGCLHIPPKSRFLDLMLAYFRYVHPSLPMINEADFWRLWPDAEEQAFQIEEFSLFVVQSMLFAACAYVSEEVITSCGFQTIREARDSFYSRAKKLLFDFEIEKNPLYRSYGSVLLTYHAPNANENRINTSWLINAIGAARIASAHEYHKLTSRPAPDQTRLKKLWWCCIIRDRILPLGVRRPLQIAEENLKSAAESSMSLSDFENELGHSRVYDTKTQKLLFQIFIHSCNLAICITPVISLVYPGENNLNLTAITPEDLRLLSIKLTSMETKMLEWCEKAMLDFTPPLLLGNLEDPIILFIGVLYIFYNGAMLAIHNRQAVLLELQKPTTDLIRGLNIASIQLKIIHAINETTDRLTEIFQAKLTQYLPLSVCAYLALPMILHLFGIKSTSNRLQFALRRRAFEVYAETMKIQKTLFNGTDFVVGLIEEVSDFIEVRRPVKILHGKQNGNSVNEYRNSHKKDEQALVETWEDLIAANPIFYLRLVTQLDIAFSTGSRPEETQFPKELQLQYLN